MKMIKKLSCLIGALLFASAISLPSVLKTGSIETKAEATVTSIKLDNLLLFGDGTNWFLTFVSSQTDWPNVDKMSEPDYYNVSIPSTYSSKLNYTTKVLINGVSVSEGNHYNGEDLICKWCRPDRFSYSVKNLPANLETIVIKKGCLLPSYQTAKGGAELNYLIDEDLTYIAKKTSNTEYMLSLTKETTKVETTVDALTFVTGYQGQPFMLFTLSANDYVFEYNGGNDYPASNSPYYGGVSDFYSKVSFNGTKLDLLSKKSYLVYKSNPNTIGVDVTSVFPTFQKGDEIVIEKDTIFPSYKILAEDGNIVYQVKNATTFTYYEGTFHICKCDLEDFDSDATSHWNVCETCGKEMNKATHTIIEGHKDPTCEEDGYENCEYCSVCGYVKTQGTVIPKLNHDFESASYKYDDEGHWKECTHSCGEKTQKETHVYGSDHKTCTYCGYVRNVYVVTLVNGYFASGSEEVAYTPDSEITIIANTPEEGMKFEAWYVGEEKVSTDNTYTFILKSDITLNAKYVEDKKPTPGPTPSKNNIPLIIGLSVAGGVLVLGGIGVCLYFFVFKKKTL